jgi:hypothetical protein
MSGWSDDSSHGVLYEDRFVKLNTWKLFPERTKYLLKSGHQKAGQMHSIKIGNRSFEDMAKIKYLGTALTDQNSMHEEIRSRPNLGMFATIRFRVFCLPTVALLVIRPCFPSCPVLTSLSFPVFPCGALL